jgi:hypothetical protein
MQKLRPPIHKKPRLLGEMLGRHREMMKQTPEAFEAFFNEFTNPKLELPTHARQWVQAALEHKRLLLNVPPRHAKTTIMAIWFTIWQFACSRETQVIVVSKTTRLGEKIANKIAYELEFNRALNTAFGRFRPQDSTRPWRVTAGELELEGKSLGARSGDLNLQIRGSGQQILGMEADWIIADDITDRRVAVSDAAMRDEWDWFLGDVMTRLAPDGKVFCIGQRVHSNDIYGRLAEERDDEGEFVWHLEKTPAILNYDTKEVLWPELWSWEKLKDRRRAVGSSIFQAMFQQQPEVSGDFVPEWWIRGNGEAETPGCLDFDRSVGEGWKVTEEDGQIVPVVRVMAVDPSPTNYCGIIVADIIYQQQATEFWCSIVDIRRDRMGQRAMMETIIELWGKHRPGALIFESNSVKWLREDVVWNQVDELFNHNIVGHSTGANKNDKLMGVWSLAADIEAGRIRFPYADVESATTSRFLIDEMLSYPNGRTDDVLMALWFIKFNYRSLIPNDFWHGHFLGANRSQNPWNMRRIEAEGKWAVNA